MSVRIRTCSRVSADGGGLDDTGEGETTAMISVRLMEDGLPRARSGRGHQRAAQPESALAPVYPHSTLPGLQPFVNFPMPVSGAVCGLPGALSTIVSVPVLVLSPVGVKVTLIVQKAPAAKEPGQSWVLP